MNNLSSWNHYNPVKVYCEQQCIERLYEIVLASEAGVFDQQGSILIVTTAGFTRRGITAAVKLQFKKFKTIVFDKVEVNPELDFLDASCDDLALEPIGAIIAVGGGSVIDTAKVLSVILNQGKKTPLAKIFREGESQSWQGSIPLVVIPTTAGTGSESTPFATVWDSVTHKKYSVIGDQLYPKAAVLDPFLTVTLPYEHTLYSGLDAISHALESLWNVSSTPVSKAFAVTALNNAVTALPAVLAKPECVESRMAMQMASFFAGVAISQTKTALAHAVSYPLTSHYGVPHGLACSFMLTNMIDMVLKRPEVRTYKELLLNVRGVLSGLNLQDRLKEYLSYSELLKLKSEMYHPERAKNFICAVADIEDLLTEY